MLETMNALAFAFLMSLFSAAPVAAQGEWVQGRVVGVSDGDTLTILTAGKQSIRVRLAEIDAPEASQAFGNRAKQELSSICFGKTARISTAKQDQYNRVLSRVSCDGIDAQSHMVSVGMAWVYDRYVRDRSLYAVQEQARSRRVGLWSDANPTPPWQFRRDARQ